MPEQMNLIERKVASLADEVQQHFTRVGEDAKQQVLSSFKTALESDVDNLKAIVNQAVGDSGQTIKDNLHQSLNKSVDMHIGGGIINSLLQNLVLPTIFNVIAGQKIDITSQKFREAAGQTLVDIGNSIARNNQRNG